MKFNFKKVMQLLFGLFALILLSTIPLGCSCAPAGTLNLEILEQIAGSTLETLAAPNSEFMSSGGLVDAIATKDSIYLTYGDKYVYKVDNTEFKGLVLDDTQITSSFAITKTDRVFVITSGKGDIYEITDFNNPRYLTTAEACTYLEIDHQNMMYAFSSSNNTVYKIDLNATTEGAIPESAVVKYVDFGDVAIDQIIIRSDNSLLFYDMTTSRLYQLGAPDQWGLYDIILYYDFNANSAFPNDSHATFAVAIDAANNLYFSLDNGDVMMFAHDASSLTLLHSFESYNLGTAIYRNNFIFTAINTTTNFEAYYNNQLNHDWTKLIKTNLFIELFYISENNEIYLKFRENTNIYRFVLDF